MRRALCVCVLGLAFAPNAAAKCLDASPVPRGRAPLTVTFTAFEATHWDFGDGTSADGQTVTHTFAAGLWPVRASIDTGVIAVISQAVTMHMPKLVGYRHRLAFRGAIVPALPNQQVLVLAGDKFFASTTTGPDGTFSVAWRISASGPYTARFGEAASTPVATTVKPLLDAKLVGSGALGEPLSVVAKLLPASVGEVRIRVWRGPRLVEDVHKSRVRLSTRVPGSFRIVVTSRANPGFASSSRSFRLPRSHLCLVVHPLAKLRLRRAKSKRGKDAGSAHSGAMGATEDAASRSFAAVGDAEFAGG